MNSLCLWLLGSLGITASLGVKLAPALTPAWLYPRIVWGGIWGVAFLITGMKGGLFRRGLLLSLGPTIVQLFVIFPYKAGKGMMGLELGMLTPAVVVFLNAVWGLAAAAWLRWTGSGR